MSVPAIPAVKDSLEEWDDLQPNPTEQQINDFLQDHGMDQSTWDTLLVSKKAGS